MASVPQLIIFALTLSLLAQLSHSLQYVPRTLLSPQEGDDPGDPLILTPYLVSGDIDKARSLSQVNGIGSFPSYSGYFTVDDKNNGNMFFWFFPSQDGAADAPVALWLQGGPGGSSMFGLFVENGPLAVDANGEMYERKVTWNQHYHMLYIDNPVGTGFSFTNSSAGLSTTEEQVADNLYNALVQFFLLFSEYLKNPFYITGESYAGKYIPALGYKIHISNPGALVKINLVGLALGDALIDPEHIVPGYADLLYNIGMADFNESAFIKSCTDKAVSYIQNKQFKDAFDVFDTLLNGDIYPYPTYFFNVTGTTNYFNYLLLKAPADFNYFYKFLNAESTRKAIHVGNIKFNDGGTDVEIALINDIMDTQVDNFVTLLENYKILLYNGQLDIIVGAPLTENFMQQLKWSGQSDYLNSAKTVWRLNGTTVGYVRQIGGTFQQVVIRNAGHILPYDQPEVALAMLQNFINLQPNN